MRGLVVLLLALLVLSPLQARQVAAQENQQPGGDLSLGQVRSPILTVDPERLYTASLYGQRVTAEVRAEAEALDLENQRIQAELTEEERNLTRLRPTLPIEEFRVAAEAFDAKVQEIRAEQDSKERALEQAVGQGQSAFLESATPILARIMIDSGAAVILDRRSVFLGVDVVDITDRAIVAIDAAIGDGAQQASNPEIVPETGIDAPATPDIDPADDTATENP